MQTLRIRRRNTTRSGTDFSTLDEWMVWQNAATIPGLNSALWRQDACGAYMYRHAYGDTNNIYGWEIDHIVPVAHFGGDDWGNLQALHWKNNRFKSDSLHQNYCVISYGA